MNKRIFFLCVFAVLFSDVSFGAENGCTPGYYISHCDSITVGTNWLKGLTQDSPDLYDYSSSNKNIENLRLFFGGKEITNTKQNGETAYVNATEVQRIRDSIINTVCLPGKITCTRCPDNAQIESSVYNTLRSKWIHFYTFADCYMRNFSDSTGEFVHVDDYDDIVRCYYDKEIKGMSLHNQEQYQQEQQSNNENGGADD